MSKVNISRVKPKLNSSETMLTIVGVNLRRNLLKSIPSSEKFFKKVKMSKPFQLFELKNVLGSCSSSHKIDYTMHASNAICEKKRKEVYVHFLKKFLQEV